MSTVLVVFPTGTGSMRGVAEAVAAPPGVPVRTPKLRRARAVGGHPADRIWSSSGRAVQRALAPRRARLPRSAPAELALIPVAVSVTAPREAGEAWRRSRVQFGRAVPKRNWLLSFATAAFRVDLRRQTYAIGTVCAGFRSCGAWASGRAGIGAVVTGLIAMVRHHERSWTVALATVLGLLPLALLLSEMALGKF